ncbi:PLDc N-terminal domain-containing protein [Natrialba asiatica]|uniref:Cardiolipin synthase N-terminal domain-containing protein n=1 Tax=Natrialba asiatica (strain ATCC 700177 / DSM 12278 / JCM 9576 / FERM P-10747 / NBRC 102637 / 172P1) TaxID=29540 RepID=M0AL79_NATA1|nr:PLDc N-terminal domain-containing protein [Natrialba asiatica]ELY98128.1 hypothetical protein C481_19380 [Natrialba asiatica DSM 12278]
MPFNIVLQSGGAGLLGLIALLFLALQIGIIIWTYTDAQSNSSHPAFLWAIVVFFAPFLGLVLYVLLGRDRMGPGRGPSGI